jgi:hypothetical protein
MIEPKLLFGLLMINFIQIFSSIFLKISRTAGQAATLVDELPLMY